MTLLEFGLTLGLQAVVGGLSGFGGVYVSVQVLRNDISWLKRTQQEHGERIKDLERTIPGLSFGGKRHG
ncbi:MAG: hypothetical protein WBR15_10830 [Gammaproteobacteria bacterium]